MTDKDGKIVWI